MGGDNHCGIKHPDEVALKLLKGYEAREREAEIGSARWDAKEVEPSALQTRRANA